MTARAPSAAESRAKSRRRTLFRGRICWGPAGAITADCAIRDLSETGAQLRIAADQPAPGSFDLIHILEGTAYRCTLAWRRGDLAGVQFESAHDLKTPGNPDLLHLRKIWLALAPV